jgi:hypothetical protein
MKSIHSATPREKELAALIRGRCIEEISTRDADEVGTTLGLAPSGLTRFIGRPTWSVDTAFRTADALDLKLVDEMIHNAQAVVTATA